MYGSEQQKMDILPSFVTGEKVGSCTSLVEVRDDPTFTGTLREVVKKKNGLFTVRLTVRGVRGGSVPLALTKQM